MTELLKRAIAEIERAPDDIQDAIAARILEELADEQLWDDQFRNTTDEQWQKIHERVERDIAEHGVTPLEELFPPRKQE